MIKFNALQKMTLTAMLLALSIIATRFIGVYVTPYVRLSAGVSITMFSSILLGPISGAVIGGVGDILGILIYNPSNVAINPIITFTYALMGATPGLLMILFRKFKNRDKIGFITLNAFLLIIWTTIFIFVMVSNSVTMFNHTFAFNTLARILIPIISFIIIILISLFTYFLNRHFKNKIKDDPRIPSPYQIAFIVLFIEVVFTLFINTGAKALFYGVDFAIIFFPALFLAFIYIPFNTLIVTYLCLLASKTIRISE